MSRKQDQAVSFKVVKAETGRPMEQGRVKKLSHNKLKSIESVKRAPLKSKAGFTLYSQPSDATISGRRKIQKSLASTPKQHQDKKDDEEQFLNQIEVVSQIQIKNEQRIAAEASGVINPAVDFATREDNSNCENFDYPELSTPFNKRLVSSTPDPEHLLETDALEQCCSQPSLMCPQMIPERDTSHSLKAHKVLTTVASSLSEKLKIQRQKFMENQKFLQQHQQQDPFTSVCHYEMSMSKKNLQPCISNKELAAVDSASMKVTKAEWVLDLSGHQCSEKDDTTLSDSVSSKENSAPSKTSTSIQPKDYTLSSKTNANSNAVDDNLNAKTKTLTKVAQSPNLMIDTKSQKDPFHNSENVHNPILQIDHNLTSQLGHNTTSLNPSTTENNLSRSSALKYQSQKHRIKSLSENHPTGPKFDELPKKTLVHVDLSSAFSKPETPTVSSNVIYFKPGQTSTESGISVVEKDVLSKPVNSIQKVKKASHRKHFLQKPTGQKSSEKLMSPKVKRKEAEFKQHYKDLSREGTDLPVKTVEKQEGLLLTSNYNFADKELDTSGDTCDLEVTQVFCDHKNNINVDYKEANSDLNEKIHSKHEEVLALVSPVSDAGNLSQVIEMLKNNGFNKTRQVEADDESVFSDSSLVVDSIDKGAPGTDLCKDNKNTSDSVTLADLMRQYLPDADLDNVNNNNNINIIEDNVKEDAEDGKTTEDVDVNQNNFHHEYSQQPSRRPKNLLYLERMVDPALRDIACRLALKATALRDIELRDLIDDMIFHTDAALEHEDARLQSAQMFFVEENNKLKKRIQIINSQLDAKERQERLGRNTTGLSDSDVHYLERKIMYLHQEKEKLDNQVTALLEEKAKWLITQQDLVRTISLKDHELLKLEEKYQEEKKVLLQSLDQVTMNSQGVHHKLSVADREIAILEENIKSRDLDIMNLQEKLKRAEDKLLESQRHSNLKDEEMLHLQDLIDTLKIGVDHVLEAYEASSSRVTTSANQRQGIENLRQIVHPEQYRQSDPVREPPREHEIVPSGGLHQHHQTFSSSQRPSHLKERTKTLFVRPVYQYTLSPRHELPQRLHPREETSHREARDSHQRSRRDDNLEKLPRRLTFRTLEEHNRRLTPIDRTLWRSLDNDRNLPPITGGDPYYSDSEIEVNGLSLRRRISNRYRSCVADNLQRQACVSGARPAPDRTTQDQNVFDDLEEIGNSKTTKYSTLRSETIPKSIESSQASTRDPFSEETYYSSLRSEPLPYQQPADQYTSEAVPHRDQFSPRVQHHSDSQNGQSLDQHFLETKHIHWAHHVRSLSVSHPSEHFSHQHSRRVPHHPLEREFQHATGSSMPRQSDREFQFPLHPPDHLSGDTHRVSHHQLSCGNYEIGSDQDFGEEHIHPVPYHHHSYHEEPLHSITTHPRQDPHRVSNISVDNGESLPYVPTHDPHQNYLGQHHQEMYSRNTLGLPTSSRHSAILSERTSFPTRSSPAHLTDISVSRRATRDSENLTQRDFFQGTELSASLSSISEADSQLNNNQLKSLDENPFSSGIATLDEKIAILQRKIDRTKAMFS